LPAPLERLFNLYFRGRLLSTVCSSNPQQVMIQIHERSNVVNVSYIGFDELPALSHSRPAVRPGRPAVRPER